MELEDDLIVHDYFRLQEYFEDKYGPRVIVLLFIGSFYEMYEYKPSMDTTPNPTNVNRVPRGHACEAAKILGMRITRRAGSKPYSLKNPLMCGFPIATYETHVRELTDADYTVIVVDQGLAEFKEAENALVNGPSIPVQPDFPLFTSSYSTLIPPDQEGLTVIDAGIDFESEPANSPYSSGGSRTRARTQIRIQIRTQIRNLLLLLYPSQST